MISSNKAIKEFCKWLTNDKKYLADYKRIATIPNFPSYRINALALEAANFHIEKYNNWNYAYLIDPKDGREIANLLLKAMSKPTMPISNFRKLSFRYDLT